MKNFKDIAGSDRSSCLIYKMVHIIVVVRYEIEKNENDGPPLKTPE